MESAFVIGVGCVAWTAVELYRMATTSSTIAMPTGARPPGSSAPKSSMPGKNSPKSHSPRFVAWDDRGQPIAVEDLGHS